MRRARVRSGSGWRRGRLATLLRAMDVSDSVPQLVERDGPHAGTAHPIPFGEHVIGRGADASVRLDLADVSRYHAKLTVGEDGVRVEDLGSKNGVFLDGTRLQEPRLLLHGRTFEVGGVTLEVDHAPSRVQQVLEGAGEPTVTRAAPGRDPNGEREPTGPGLLWPVVGAVVFAALAALAFLL